MAINLVMNYPGGRVVVMDRERLLQKLDGSVLLCAFLAMVVIPVCHIILHHYVFTVRMLLMPSC
jgi:hypothetical protein